jgi:MscS family membrane protein
MDNFLANLSKDEISALINLFDYQIAILIILIVFVTKSVVAKIIVKILNKILKRENKAEESAIYAPIKWMYVFLGVYLAILILPKLVTLNVIMKTVLKVAVIIFIINIINSTVFVKDSKLFKNSKRKNEKTNNETINEFICKILRFLVWIVGIYIIFLNLGWDLSGLITGLGLGTVIISLAAQDTVKSLLSGFTILSDKPFVIGDWIKCGDYAGTVIDITFRSTRIRCADNSIVTIPNSTITTDYVINWNKLKARRFDCTLNLEMDITPDKIKEVIKELKVVICSKDYVKTDTVYVGFNKIADYSIDIKIFLYVKETDYVKYLKIEEDLNCEFLKVLANKNVGLAYPTETIHVKNS